MKIRANVLLLALLFSLSCLSLAGGSGAENYRIGIVTASFDQGMDELLGARAFQEKYGEDRVVLRTYPDDFTTSREKSIETISGLADDPRIMAVIVNQGVPGTAEAFRIIHEKRPEVLCLVGQSHEDPEVIEAEADLIIRSNNVLRGYILIREAAELGCDTFVHISFPRHRLSESMHRRMEVMKAACSEFGIRYVDETAPDPAAAGTEEARAFLMQALPGWIETYGRKAAFFCTNDAHTAPVISRVLEYGGYFIEADLPSPLRGYPEALGLELTDFGNDFPGMVKAVEEEVCRQGGAGRFGTWTYSYGYALSAGLAQYAMDVLEGTKSLNSLDDLLDAVTCFTPGAVWQAGSLTEKTEETEEKAQIFWLLQDTYILGSPGFFLTGLRDEIPETYLSIR